MAAAPQGWIHEGMAHSQRAAAGGPVISQLHASACLLFGCESWQGRCVAYHTQSVYVTHDLRSMLYPDLQCDGIVTPAVYMYAHGCATVPRAIQCAQHVDPHPR